MRQNDFEDTRPYYDHEIPDAIKRVSENIYFPELVKFLFPNGDIKYFFEKFRKIATIDQFQFQIMDQVIRITLKLTTKEFSYSGFEKLTNDKSYIYISNHRDILLDSAILQVILHECNLKTSEITFGSNLMSSQFVIDIGKMNKMFKIDRGGTAKEIFANSLKVSQYMRYAITEKKESIWIAQRNGRTKNGDDKTETAVLKMFAMGSAKPFVPNFLELNITPVAISYMYEPCDFLKTREIYISRRKTYVKNAEEDINSIVNGIKQWKENLHIAVCDTITKEELIRCNALPQNEKYKRLAQIIDQKIFARYQLWTTNYIAYDLLHDTDKFSSRYSNEQKEQFSAYMNAGLQDIEGDISELQNIFLNIYALPVKNCMSIKKMNI